ncbi:TPA: hypothetical protein RI350_004030 [Escherichia coli]|nr:hypothetical protein [Escherichia coli]ELU1392847.1 hypothetical protein [Escherichia coli]HAZ7566032.1 hypothetical protein [Escherichia coli]HDP9369649.1 hypothetical protein [Escherichia coli]HDP9405624.1 hypothetical protein [Escherichia coli]
MGGNSQTGPATGRFREVAIPPRAAGSPASVPEINQSLEQHLKSPAKMAQQNECAQDKRADENRVAGRKRAPEQVNQGERQRNAKNSDGRRCIPPAACVIHGVSSRVGQS